MSRFVSIKTELRDREVLTECLEHLHCQVLYEKDGIAMRGARTPVQMLAHASFGAVGFRHTPSAGYELVAEEEVLEEHQRFFTQLRQQYAYRKVLKDAGQAGYTVVKEEASDDNSIRLVVRKW